MNKPEKQLENLQNEAAFQTEKIKELTQKNEALTLENQLLRDKIDILSQKLFGKSSEQLDPAQMQMLLEGLEPKKLESDDAPEQEAESLQQEEPKRDRKPRTPRKETLPKDLEVEEILIIPEEVKANQDLYREIDEEVTEKLDFEPEKFKRIIIRRKKFVKKLTPLGSKEADKIHIAPLPPSLKEKSLLTPRLAAEIAVNRFCNHLPYYRQEQHFLIRHRVHLPRNTMSQWMNDLAYGYLIGIYQAMHNNMLVETYLQADETPIEYLEPGNGTTKKGYLWTLSRPDIRAEDGRGDILYQWHPGRSAECLQELLRTDEEIFIGILQCDGYKAYETFRAKEEDIELAGCWAHVRRKFIEAKKQRPKLSGWILNQIKHLYRIEKRLRTQKVGARERERVRLHESIPIYKRIEKGLNKIQLSQKILPKSNLGKAISYALGQRDKLEACFRNGQLEIDNNLIENGIRPTKLGAKNWLFMGSETAGQTNAIWFTIIESCRRRKLDPWNYLVWIFEELPKIKVKKDTFKNHTPEAYAKQLKKLKAS